MKTSEILAYDKAVNVINSCTNMEQLKVAREYIWIFNKMYGSTTYFRQLDHILSTKWLELQSPISKKN